MPSDVALRIKAPGQIEQGYGSSPVWVRMWGITWLLPLKILGQIEQGCGFSPVLARSCLMALLLSPNPTVLVEQGSHAAHPRHFMVISRRWIESLSNSVSC